MHPARTDYRLAHTLDHYKLCHALMDATETPKQALAFPTVYALRDGIILGFLSSYTKGGAVCAGPLVLDPTQKAPGLTAIRLLDAYELILKAAGVSTFLFHIAKANPQWKALVDKFDLHPYHETEDAWWYRKEL